MSAKKLDKKQPYGTIYGDSLGRVYEQDGLYFRADGTQWTDGKAVKAPAAPAPAPASDAGDQLSQQMGE